jgi:hypothetical protein
MLPGRIITMPDFAAYAAQIKSLLGITGGSATPGGSTGQAQYNNGSSFSGMAGLPSDANGFATVGDCQSTDPATPTAGLTLFSRLRSGKRNLAVMQPSGIPTEIQSAMWQKKVALATAPGASSTSISTVGLNLANTGTALAVTYDPSTFLGSIKRLSRASTAATAQ